MDDGGSPNIAKVEKKSVFRKFFGRFSFSSTDDVTEEEIIFMVNEGHEQGVLLESEAEMIHNIFEFGDKEAGDIMTHRKSIIALDGDSSFRDALNVIVEKRYSRFPVYLDNIDHIIGVLHIKEALLNSQKQELMALPIRDIEGLVREVDYIPETRNIDTLFQDMQLKKSHMVIVVDEYGQTAGLVAMEDILEEIVGNIFDEHDEEKLLIEAQPDGSFVMDGMAPLDEVADILGLGLEAEDYDTLNGFLISRIDKIPDEHEVFDVQYENYVFHIDKVEDKMIKSVHVMQASEEGLADRMDTSCQSSEKMIE